MIWFEKVLFGRIVKMKVPQDFKEVNITELPKNLVKIYPHAAYDNGADVFILAKLVENQMVGDDMALELKKIAEVLANQETSFKVHKVTHRKKGKMQQGLICFTAGEGGNKRYYWLLNYTIDNLWGLFMTSALSEEKEDWDEIFLRFFDSIEVSRERGKEHGR